MLLLLMILDIRITSPLLIQKLLLPCTVFSLVIFVNVVILDEVERGLVDQV